MFWYWIWFELKILSTLKSTAFTEISHFEIENVFKRRMSCCACWHTIKFHCQVTSCCPYENQTARVTPLMSLKRIACRWMQHLYVFLKSHSIKCIKKTFSDNNSNILHIVGFVPLTRLQWLSWLCSCSSLLQSLLLFQTRTLYVGKITRS